jgi:hypothetical protein
MPEQYASVTVTVTQGGATTVYEVHKVTDFKAAVDERRRPAKFGVSWKLSEPRDIRGITFSMRTLPDDAGEYARVHLPHHPLLEEKD